MRHFSHWTRGVIRLPERRCSSSFFNFNKVVLSVIAYTYFLRGPVHVLLCLTMRGELRSLKPSWLRVDFTETRRPGCTWLSLCGHLSHLLGKNWCNSMTEILFYQAAVSLSLILLHTLLAIDLLLLFFFFFVIFTVPYMVLWCTCPKTNPHFTAMPVTNTSFEWVKAFST